MLCFMLLFFNIFVIICSGFMPGCYFTLTWMAVRFARRVKLSSDYIDHLFWEILERRISLCWPLLTWLQWSHCVRLFIVLVTCVESMIPRRKNNRPTSWENLSGYSTIENIRRTVISSTFLFIILAFLFSYVKYIF